MSAIQSQPVRVPAQSTFVNVVAWISIVLSGGAACISLLQFVLFMTVFKSDEVQQQLASGPDATPNSLPEVCMRIRFLYAIALAV